MITEIKPSQKRHVAVTKSMLLDVCCVLDNVKKPEGYIVMAWDARGRTAVQTQGGGMISIDLMPIHAFSQLTICAR